MTANWKGTLALLVRILVGGTLATAGYMKLLSPAEEFAAVLGAEQILPAPWIFPAAHLLPWAELFLGSSLLLGYLTKASAWGNLILLASFIISTALSLWKGTALSDCGCFGTWGPKLSPAQILGLDSLLLLGVVLLVRYHSPGTHHPWSLDAWLNRKP